LTTGDAFLASHDRVRLVATDDAMVKAVSAGNFVLSLRMKRPLSHDPAAAVITPNELPAISRDARDRIEALADQAADDVIRLRLRTGRTMLKPRPR
jgi:hypothetical protein